MSDHEKEIGIPDNHKLVQTDSKWRQSKGLDTDTYWYDQVDETGAVVAKWIVKDSTSIYPPFGRNISSEKVG
ncbi:hypothetical protein SAMN05421546_0020 [Solilutibacter tolerans]|uniref:Uncharacterized protein n=1 Tax=Solilutibacter tolerans TaxID=1604334 RepID=A0A1N6YN07_9GAMM|nr:hypothetical protein SAMN05421546_0020 [Lysobacter tolerans]